MHIIIGLAIGLIIGGLLMAFLSKSVGPGLLATIVYYVGVVLVVVGLILLLAPVIAWLAAQLHSMLGV